MTITLKSGITINANKGLVSVSPDLEELYEGYDGPIWLLDDDDQAPRFTKEDLHQLADLMIDRWQQFKAHVDAGKVPTK